MKIYAILDKASNSLYGNWVTCTNDIREIRAVAERWTNDEDRGGVIYRNPEDFAMIEVATVNGDHLELPVNERKQVVPYNIIFNFRDLKKSS